jgi:hypothetical protein
MRKGGGGGGCVGGTAARWDVMLFRAMEQIVETKDKRLRCLHGDKLKKALLHTRGVQTQLTVSKVQSLEGSSKRRKMRAADKDMDLDTEYVTSYADF